MAWYRNYGDTLIQRDIQDLARIGALDALPLLLALAAGQTACLSNVSELAAPFQISRSTIREYITLLSRIFLLEELPPRHSNRKKRLIKTPELHLGNTGLACALLGMDTEMLWQDRALFGHLLETFIHQYLKRHASWHDDTITFSHFRSKDKVEIDIVLESGGLVTEVVSFTAKENVLLTEDQIQALEKKKDDLVSGDIETAHPAYPGSQDTFYVGA